MSDSSRASTNNRLAPARKLARFIGLLATPVAPQTCWITGTPLQSHEHGLTDAVRQKIAQLVLEPYCHKCGSSSSQWASPANPTSCLRCPTRRLGLDVIVRAGALAPPLNHLIAQIKFHRRWELTHLLAPLLAQALQQALLRQPTAVTPASTAPRNILVPLPLHWRRRFWRGFNQAEEIAAQTADILNWPVFDCLKRIRYTSPQATADSATARANNMRGAFAVANDPRLQSKMASQIVWLVDDICTTGATLQAAAAALRALPKNVRPASINAAVVAVTSLHPAT
ncbi:MAG: hypothetical protein HKL96_11380 [Phycisphaerales bacterium]|nr:hypothetical protein [Phycisphaerales bacterium]